MEEPILASGRFSKKVRCKEEPSYDGGDEVMMVERRSKLFSFWDAVVNTGSEAPSMESDWEMEDFFLHEDDVSKFVAGGVPIIDFTLNFTVKVYGLIDESVSKILIVKLLGGKNWV